MRAFFVFATGLILESVALCAQVPGDPQYVLFRAKPQTDAVTDTNAGTDTSVYVIPFGESTGVIDASTGRKVFAIHAKDRQLDDVEVGIADVIEVGDTQTVLRVTFVESFTPKAGESVLIDVPVRPLNRFYVSSTFAVASYGIRFLSVEGEALLEFASFDDDGLELEADQIRLLRRDVI